MLRNYFYLPIHFLLNSSIVNAFFLNKIVKDYQALTRRVTARHILLPLSCDLEVVLQLKQKIRNKCIDEGRFVVNAFEDAALKFSIDKSTKLRGGLIGELVPPGYCSLPELDKACFQVSLGNIEGPIQTSYGYHLILVSERTNCRKLDGVNTKLIENSDVINGKINGMGKLVPSKQEGEIEIGQFIKDTIIFSFFVIFAGGVLAEIVATI